MKNLSNKFIVVIPAFNAEHSIVKCISSVLVQTFDDVGIVIRDDLSTDNTVEVVKDYLGMKKDQYFTSVEGKDILVIKNSTKFYGAGNTHDSAINYVSNKDAIVGVVDGDDCLISDEALQKIYNIYLSKGVWLVWSQHQLKSSADKKSTGYSSALPTNEALYNNREYWSVSHFRTCKSWLFNEINKNDLCDPFGKNHYCQYAGDASILYPIIEMCGNEKSFFLDEVLYLYNDNLPTNEHNISSINVEKYSKYIRTKQKRYTRINNINSREEQLSI
jgi:glycosyltransferase involved in cell wall biosynthesis